MITESDIENALDDVSESVLAGWLADTNQFYELADAIANIAVNGQPVETLNGNIQQLVNMCRDHHWKTAEKIARDKSLAGARMKDDFDDWYLNAEMGRMVA